MSIEKKDIDMQKIVLELEYTNKALYEINKNLANLVLLHQVQLVAVEEALQQSVDETDTPKKKIH
jgi:hypothetical protein|tara:strand:+ start:293 stop:487 length:195 start_codon:yes stop_codon:yes gene_type:complete